jgi:hypothetical protein
VIIEAKYVSTEGNLQEIWAVRYTTALSMVLSFLTLGLRSPGISTVVRGSCTVWEDVYTGRRLGTLNESDMYKHWNQRRIKERLR